MDAPDTRDLTPEVSDATEWSDHSEALLAAQVRAAKAREARLSKRLAIWLVGPLATILVALILVFFVLFDTSHVSGQSMMPTLRNADLVLLTKGDPNPQRGDIVILNVVNQGVPEEWVKRIVALPGDIVDVNGDIILVNGKAEQFQHIIMTSGATTPIKHLTVEPDRIFVAGDNRGVSEDSRYVGTFPLTAIKGRVFFIYAPITRIGPVPSPAH
jgi:signal peptidase I